MLTEAVIDDGDASAFKYVAENSKGKKGINIRLLDAYLTYYLHIRKPGKLSDREWAEQVQNLHFIRVEEKKASENQS